jgi:ribonuclease Z
MIGMTASPSKRPIEIFGPEGLRQWIRTTLKLCHAQIPIKYVVHELVLQEEKAWKRAAKWNVIEEKHQDELSGNDIICSKDGLWHV